MKKSPSIRHTWRLEKLENTNQEEYKKTLEKLTFLLANEASEPKLLHKAETQAKQFFHSENQDYSKLIKDFEVWLEQHYTQEQIAAYLTASLVSLLAAGDFATLMPRFLRLKYYCSSLGQYWVNGVIAVSKNNLELKINIANYAKQQLTKLDKLIAARYPEEAQLSWIWAQHYDRHNDLINPHSDWPWFDLLWQLEPLSFLNFIPECKSPYTVSGILIWAGLTGDFNLWQQAMREAPSAFTENGSWNGSFLMPMLLAEAGQRLLESISDYKGYPQQDIDLSAKPEINTLINDVVVTISARKDFIGLIKPWSIQLFKNIDNHSKKNSIEGQLYQALLVALMEQLSSKQQLSEALDSDSSDNWLYFSLLGWMASSFPQASIPLPNPADFVKQWQFNHHSEHSWFGAKGEKLLSTSSEFSYQELSSSLIEYLAVTLTLGEPKNTAKYWQKMWQGTHQLREAVIFNTPMPKSCSQRSHDAARLNFLLLSIGLAMLKQLEAMIFQDTQQLETTINDLFTSLWKASFTLLRIDSFNKDKIHTIQLNMLLMRALWQKAAGQGNQQYTTLNKTLTLTHVDLLQDLQSNVTHLITLLPNYKANSITDEWLLDELTAAGLSINELLSTAEKMIAFNSNQQLITKQSLDTLRQLLDKHP